MSEILCWCGSGKPYEECHKEIEDEIRMHQLAGEEVPTRQMIKTPEQIAGIREACKLNTAVLDEVAKHIKKGMTTEEIDRIVYDFTVAHGGIPAPLNFCGFPKSVCTSINDVVCHGIPSEKVVLRSGDIVNIDVSTILNNYYGDASRMFEIGRVDKKAKDSQLAHKHGYSVVEEFGGHGVGVEFHEDPFVAHVGKKGTGMLLVPGMIFTIEPMINTGRKNIFIDEKDEWTVYTEDGSLSAQWEYTVLVTDSGVEVLSW